MKDFKFTGRLDGDNIDVVLRTDAINTTDENFNVTQIQIGNGFSINDSQNEVYQKHFGRFKLQNVTRGELVQFAEQMGLDLIISDGNGNNTVAINDEASVSDSGFGVE